jgi:hypothetical protein
LLSSHILGTFGQKKTRLQFLKSLAVLGPILIFIEFNLPGRSYKYHEEYHAKEFEKGVILAPSGVLKGEWQNCKRTFV